MTQLIFHVGMGKTGSTTLQTALHDNADALAAAGCHYLGQWMGFVRPEFDSFLGFQSFLQQTPDQLAESAHRLLTILLTLEKQTGAQRFILSNEQYLENIPVLGDFFKILAAHVNLQVVIFVRPPATWLPSAYAQWGIVHKTNEGPVSPFPVKARELMLQYGFVQQWRERLGPVVTVMPYDDTRDVVQDFASLLNISMASGAERLQARPSVSELLLRAACNSVQWDMVLPDLFNAISEECFLPDVPVRLSEKFNHIFNRQELPAIIAEHQDTLSYIERECGVSMTTPVSSSPEYNLPDMTDELLGRMISMVLTQALQIRGLRSRLDRLDRELQERDHS